MVHGRPGYPKLIGEFLEGVAPRSEQLEDTEPPNGGERLVESHQLGR